MTELFASGVVAGAVAGAVIWLGVRLARANRMLDDLLDELRIDDKENNQ